MKIRSISISEQRVQLVKPFVTSNFSIRERQFLVLSLQTGDGIEGRGDIAPLNGFSNESYEQAKQALIDSQEWIREIELPGTATELAKLVSKFDAERSLPPTVAFGIELALAEIASKVSGQPMALWYRNDSAKSVEVNAILSIGDKESRLREKLGRGYRTFKLKVGTSSIKEEVSRISKIRSLLGDEVTIRLDANRAFSFDDAREFMAGVKGYQIEYIEEPLKNNELERLPRLRSEGMIPIAIDETLLERTAESKVLSTAEFISVIQLDSFDIAIFKPSLMGSVSRTLAWAQALQEESKELVVTSALDSAHSVAAALHIACAAKVTRACGLDTAALIEDVADRRNELLAGPILNIGITPGVGCVSGHNATPISVQLIALHGDRNKTALRTTDQQISYSQLIRLVTGCRSQFDELGMRRGSMIAILAANSIDYIVTLLASAYHGLRVAVLNTRLSEQELTKQLNQIDPLILLSDSRHLSTARKLHQRVQMLEDVCRLETADQRDEAGLEVSAVDQPFCIVFTSGSTGEPKGVALSVGNVYYSALGANELVSLGEGDTWHLSLPLYHVGGLGIIFRCLIAGAAVYVDDRFIPAQINALIDAGEVTHLSLVPTMLDELMKARERRALPARFKAILLGGAAPGEALIKKIRDHRLPVYTSFGLSEAASVVTAEFVPDAHGAISTSGRALPYRRIKLFDNGEIGIAGEVVAKEYLNSHKPLVDNEGWFHTGDIGQLDDSGNLTVLGRIDDMMISGGENIFPREIEEAAERIRAIRCAAVVPIQHAKWGQRPVLFVELCTGEVATEESIRRELSLMIAKFKIPDRVFVLPHLPRTALGKIDKQQLIELAKRL